MQRKDPHEILANLQKKYGDVFKTTDCQNEGVTYDQIMRMINDMLIEQFDRGLFVVSGSDEDGDDLYLLQQKYPKGVVSGVGALYLHGFSVRLPDKFTFTFPKGYNSKTIKDEDINYNWVIKENYELGISEATTMYGNKVKAYDIERCLCDILRGKGEDIQIVNEAFKKYCVYPERDFDKLMRYAKQLHVDKKVSTYLEILS